MPRYRDLVYSEAIVGAAELDHSVIHGSVADLAVASPAFHPEQSCAEALAFFASHPQHETLPVVKENRPVGLILRTSLVERFARPFHHELFGNKTCTTFMDSNALVADCSESIAEIGATVAASARNALQDGFIVTSRQRYAGIVTGQALVRALADIQLARSRQIMESLRYASRIQRALLHTSNEELDQWLPMHRLLWEPRDVVGGDYYFCRGTDGRVLVVIIDCTGHGVPGALMTMIMTASLEAAVKEIPSLHTGQILAAVNRRVRQALGQQASSTDLPAGVGADSPNDGMDAAAVLIDRVAGRLQFSGARLPLFVLYPGERGWIYLPGGRCGVGYVDTPDATEWPVNEVRLESGMRLTIATDGVFDQIGGPKAIAYGKVRFSHALGSASGRTLADHFDTALDRYRAWQGSHTRRDDVTMMMVEV